MYTTKELQEKKKELKEKIALLEKMEIKLPSIEHLVAIFQEELKMIKIKEEDDLYQKNNKLWHEKGCEVMKLSYQLKTANERLQYYLDGILIKDETFYNLESEIKILNTKINTLEEERKKLKKLI